MIDTGKILQSSRTLRVLGAEVDPWMTTNYQQAGVYFSLKSNWYFIFDGTAVQGVSKSTFEAAFVEIEPQPIPQAGVDGIKDEIFLKTVALLSGRASEFKDL